MRIGLIGAGAIAEFLLAKINTEDHPEMNITSVMVRNREKYKFLEATYHVTLHTQLKDFLHSGIDIVVEAANVEAIQATLPELIKEKDVMVISIGALVDDDFVQEIATLADHHGNTLHVPSGAVGGQDVVQNAKALGELSEVKLTTRKPAHTLTETPLSHEKTVFAGSAAEAIKQFPKNINVSIVLALAGIGTEETQVRIIADPAADSNTHHIDANGAFGSASFSIRNAPLPENPNTSYLAAMSILGSLQRLHHHIRID